MLQIEEACYPASWQSGHSIRLIIQLHTASILHKHRHSGVNQVLGFVTSYSVLGTPPRIQEMAGSPQENFTCRVSCTCMTHGPQASPCLHFQIR